MTRRRLLAGVAGAVGLLAAGRVARADAAVYAYDDLLARYVVVSPDGINRVDYAAWSATPDDRRALIAFVEAEARRDPSQMPPAERFAYWTNLYNALTLVVVLDAYPVRSIRDIKSKGRLLDPKSLFGPWRTRLVTVAGQRMSLDDIEHDALRAGFNDPRVHYAVNCASLGCPNLLSRPWQAETLEADLDKAARAYVNHPRGVTVLAPGKLKVSSLYKWYEGDFGGSEAGIVAHLRRHADPPLATALAGAVRIAADDYDWSLNDASRPS
jgi:Protein of unknown function, DUF547